MDSILLTIKTMLDVEEEDESFDSIITAHINTALMALNQLGVGPPDTGVVIEGNDEKWDLIFTVHPTLNVQSVKSYIYLKVKLLFDPPAASYVIEAYNRQLSEIETRLLMEVDPPPEEEV